VQYKVDQFLNNFQCSKFEAKVIILSELATLDMAYPGPAN